jgi:transcriptional regulator with XRE-family HTH domain
MPSIDERAKAWELELSGRVGAAVQARRKARKLTALDLADKCRGLGYPITRVAISKIETNNRRGKLDVAELIVLAKALDIPPVLLLAPDFPDGHVETVPGRETESRVAVKWFSGVLPSMWTRGDARPDPELNDGAVLVQLVEFAAGTDERLQEQIERASKDSSPKAAEEAQELQQTRERLAQKHDDDIRAVRAALWAPESDG